jgi:outer membrane protein TolC
VKHNPKNAVGAAGRIVGMDRHGLYDASIRVEGVPMRILFLALVVAGWLSTAGCHSYVAQTDVTAPPPSAKPLPAEPGEAGTEAEPAPDAPQYKKTITVEQAVAESLEHNREVALARVNETISGTFRKEALSAMLPHFGGHVTWTRRDSPQGVNTPSGSFIVGPKDQTDARIFMDFPIFAFGKYLNGYRAAKLAEQQAGADTETSESDIAAAVTAAAFDLLETQSGVAVARDNEKAFEQQVKDAKALQDAGRVTAEAVLEAEVQHDVARRSREKLQSLVPIRRMVLNRLLGRPVRYETELVDAPVQTPIAFTLKAVQEEALERRPEIRSARFALLAAQRNYKSVYGGELGELRGLAAWNWTDNETAFPADWGTLGVTLDIPIWTGGRRTARIRRARDEVQGARLTLDDLVERVLTDVSSKRRRTLGLSPVSRTAWPRSKSVSRASRSSRRPTLAMKVTPLITTTTSPSLFPTAS